MTASNPNDLTVIITSRESRCDECKEALGRHAWITLEGDGRALCLPCADLDHLVFLPSGDTALTRRARKHSRLSAVVLKWSQARNRYERQGLLVEEDALTQAEETGLSGTYHAFGFSNYAERYLGAITYHFNRRFDLHALPNRLLVAAARCGQRPKHWIRMAETHC